MNNKSYVVAIDLGESSVIVAVGSRTHDGLILIESVVNQPSDGVRAGTIENIALVGESIKRAVEAIEERLEIRIVEAYAGISGEFVRFACHTDHVYVTDPQNGVSQNDVNALFDRMRHVQAPENEAIMERIPQNYMVDDAKEVKNPVGSFGRRLSSTFNFILCGNTPMQRLENALRRLNIRLIKSYPNALVVADSVLTPDEKEEGVAVVNIGSGLTDLTIYYRNVVRYIVSIPMGASAVNQDIRSMMIPDKYIERLKRDYGSAVADLVSDNKAVKVNGRTPRESKNILLYNLAVAIEARMTMIIEFVKREIIDSGYEDKLPYGIVITGGSANLKNIDELFRRLTNLEVRIGTPIEGVTEDSIDKVDSPEYATAVGLLLRGAEVGDCKTAERPTVTRVPSQPRTFEQLGNSVATPATPQMQTPPPTPAPTPMPTAAPAYEPTPAPRPTAQPTTQYTPQPTAQQYTQQYTQPERVEPRVVATQAPTPTPAPAPIPTPAPVPTPSVVAEPSQVSSPMPTAASVAVETERVQPEVQQPEVQQPEPTPIHAPTPAPEPTPRPASTHFTEDVSFDDIHEEEEEEVVANEADKPEQPSKQQKQPQQPYEPRNGNRWGKFFQGAFKKINDGFSSASDSGDEEI